MSLGNYLWSMWPCNLRKKSECSNDIYKGTIWHWIRISWSGDRKGQPWRKMLMLTPDRSTTFPRQKQQRIIILSNILRSSRTTRLPTWFPFDIKRSHGLSTYLIITYFHNFFSSVSGKLNLALPWLNCFLFCLLYRTSVACLGWRK